MRTAPQRGLRFSQPGALLPKTQSKVATGIFLVKLKAREAGWTLHEAPAPGGLWVGFGGGLGTIPQVTDDWTFHLRERRTHAGKSTSNPRLPGKQSERRKHSHQPQGKLGKAGRTEADSPLQQLLPRTGSKMSLKLPRNWDFTLKGEAGKMIGTVRVILLPLWFFYLSPHYLHAGLQGE